MEMFHLILKGIIIGVCASVPVGPTAIFVIQRSLCKGRKGGFTAGMGACLADTTFAIIAVFALAFVQSFLAENKLLVDFIGGAIVIALGLNMTFSNPFRKRKINMDDCTSGVSPRDFIQAYLMGLSNPGAVLAIFALFTFFGVQPSAPYTWSVAPLIISVCGGAMCYWLGLSYALSRCRNKFKLTTLIWTNRVLGILVILFGVILVVDGLFSVLFPNIKLL